MSVALKTVIEKAGYLRDWLLIHARVSVEGKWTLMPAFAHKAKVEIEEFVDMLLSLDCEVTKVEHLRSRLLVMLGLEWLGSSADLRRPAGTPLLFSIDPLQQHESQFRDLLAILNQIAINRFRQLPKFDGFSDPKSWQRFVIDRLVPHLRKLAQCSIAPVDFSDPISEIQQLLVVHETIMSEFMSVLPYDFQDRQPYQTAFVICLNLRSHLQGHHTEYTPTNLADTWEAIARGERPTGTAQPTDCLAIFESRWPNCDATVRLHGIDIRTTDKGAKLIALLKIQYPRYVPSRVLERIVGRRPDHIVNELDPRLQLLIDLPRTKGHGCRLVLPTPEEFTSGASN